VIELVPAVADFAQEVQDLFDDVLVFGAKTTADERQIKVVPYDDRYVVRTGTMDKLAGIPLFASGDRVARLEVEFRCDLDRSTDYLAVRKSKIQLLPVRKEDPLFRLDYCHESEGTPEAHWNIHAERGAVSALLERANPAHSGRLSKVHFTVGGARHRPCLEDVLEMLVVDFNIDVQDGWLEAIHKGRERWRTIQTKVLVRDAPELAASLLRKLGYAVEAPESGPVPTDSAKLRRA
jgi:hypothetical protein